MDGESAYRGGRRLAHTGRGLRLSDEECAFVLAAWRKALPRSTIPDRGRWMLAAVGRTWSNDNDSAAMARQASDLVRCLLVHPPAAFRGRPDLDDLVLDYHAAVAEAGLPLILFYLYEAAGGDRLRTGRARPSCWPGRRCSGSRSPRSIV